MNISSCEMAQHTLATLGDEERRLLLAYYRNQEAAKQLTIKCSPFQDGELLIIKYTDEYNETTAPTDWDWRMELARGCVLFKRSGCAPEVVAQVMPKFHSYGHCPEAVRHIEADGVLSITQKFDGSCITVTFFHGELLVFTLGARQNTQTRLARELLSERAVAAIQSMEGRTLAMELIHRQDGKVEQSRGLDRLVLLYACESDGRVLPVTELRSIAETLGVDVISPEDSTGLELLRRLEVLNSVTSLNDMREGFVVELLGKKYKAKPHVYKSVAGKRSPPQPNSAWMARCFISKNSMAEVREEVAKMQAAPLDYGAVATTLFDHHLARVDEKVQMLRGLHPSYADAKELSQSGIAKGDKLLLFPCMKLPLSERDAWLDGDVCRFGVAQNLAKASSESTPDTDVACRGFAVGSGRLVLAGAPGKKALEAWVKGCHCVVTLLRSNELQDRGLDLAGTLGPLSVEWLHLPISGASLEDPEDKPTAFTAAQAVVERLQQGKTVAVHCSAGLHRTGLVGYLSLRLLGWSMPAAFELLGQIRWETRVEIVERGYYNSSSRDAANIILVAEELLPQPGAPQESIS